MLKLSEEEVVISPGEAIESLSAARGELQLVLDLVDKLENQEEIGVSNVPDTRTHSGRLGAMARETALRCASARDSLKDSAVILKGGVEALRERSRRENNFYLELAKLQGFWKVKLNPSIGSRSAFFLDLSLGRVAEQKNHPSSKGFSIDIYQDALGKLKIYMPKETLGLQGLDKCPPIEQQEVEEGLAQDTGSPGNKADSDHVVEIVGGQAVHRALLMKQRELIWTLLQATLRSQGVLTHRGSSFNAKAQELLSHVGNSSEPQIAALKPLLLKRFLAYIFQTPMDSSMPSQVSPQGMMSEIIAWASHSFHSRRLAWRAIEEKALPPRSLLLHWQPTWHSYVSSTRVTIPGRFTGLMIVRSNKVEVEGKSIAIDGSSRHLSTAVTLQDVGELTNSLVKRSSFSFMGSNE